MLVLVPVLWCSGAGAGAGADAGADAGRFDSGTWPPANTSQAQTRDQRIKWWLDASHAFGHVTESSTRWLHVGRGDGVGAVFFVGLADGALEQATGELHCGLYAGADAWVTLPTRMLNTRRGISSFNLNTNNTRVLVRNNVFIVCYSRTPRI